MLWILNHNRINQTQRGGGGEKVQLEVSPDKISIKLKGEATQAAVADVLAGLDSFEELTPLSAAPGFYVARLKREATPSRLRQYVRELRANPQVTIVNPVYQVEGTEVIPFDRFIVRFDSSLSSARVEELNRKHHVEVVRISTAVPNLYTLRITPASDRSVVEMAQLYFESLPAVYALPDFVVPIERHRAPGDPYYPYQYYFNQSNNIDINAPGAWNLTKGRSSITVAVIDDGGRDVHRYRTHGRGEVSGQLPTMASGGV